MVRSTSIRLLPVRETTIPSFLSLSQVPFTMTRWAQGVAFSDFLLNLLLRPPLTDHGSRIPALFLGVTVMKLDHPQIILSAVHTGSPERPNKPLPLLSLPVVPRAMLLSWLSLLWAVLR